MYLGEKRKTVEILEKLRLLNYKSAFIYKIALSKEKRLILKNFYYKLYRQKLDFVKEIEEKIELLKREISPIQDPKLLSFYQRKNINCPTSTLNIKCNDMLIFIKGN